MNSKFSEIRDELLGKEFETNACGKCFIIDYKSSRDVTVMFYSPLYVTKCRMDNLTLGKISNPFYPTVYNKGYFGAKNKKSNVTAYNLWHDMMKRAYSKNIHAKNSAYRDVEVCDEWLNYQNFESWCEGQKFFTAKDMKGKNYHLDKDIINKGNKVYSPKSCCFIPQEVNNLLVLKKTVRGKYPLGVCYNKRKSCFVAYIDASGRKHLGYHNNPDEAFQAYKVAKEDYIKEVAEKWKGKISDKVYDALMDWEINIDD